jgi:hypothetical protein
MQCPLADWVQTWKTLKHACLTVLAYLLIEAKRTSMLRRGNACF